MKPKLSPNIPLNTDGADGGAPADILDVDLNTVDTKFPVIKGGLYDLKLLESSIGDNADKTGETWTLKFATTTETTSTANELLPPGTVSFDRVGLTTTAKYTKEMIARNVGAVVQGANPKVEGMTMRSFRDRHKELVGRIFRVK